MILDKFGLLGIILKLGVWVECFYGINCVGCDVFDFLYVDENMDWYGIGIYWGILFFIFYEEVIWFGVYLCIDFRVLGIM